MPFYEYQCGHCGHHHEELQKVTDKPLRKCPECGRLTLKRLMSAPVFRLKGGGWYETDFKSDKEGKRNLAGETEPATEKKAEPVSKPAAGVEKKADPAPAKKEPETKATAAVKKPEKSRSAAKKTARQPARRR